MSFAVAVFQQSNSISVIAEMTGGSFFNKSSTNFSAFDGNNCCKLVNSSICIPEVFYSHAARISFNWLSTSFNGCFCMAPLYFSDQLG